MYNPWNALQLTVLCGIPTSKVVEEGDFEFRDIRGGVDGEIESDGGEDDDSAYEKNTKKGKK